MEIIYTCIISDCPQGFQKAGHICIIFKIKTKLNQAATSASCRSMGARPLMWGTKEDFTALAPYIYKTIGSMYVMVIVVN